MKFGQRKDPHLTALELLELLEGRGVEAARGHLERCRLCARQERQLRLGIGELRQQVHAESRRLADGRLLARMRSAAAAPRTRAGGWLRAAAVGVSLGVAVLFGGAGFFGWRWLRGGGPAAGEGEGRAAEEARVVAEIEEVLGRSLADSLRGGAEPSLEGGRE